MKNTLLKLTQDLVRFKSVTGDVIENKKCIDYVRDYLGPKALVEVYEKEGVYSLVATHSETKTPEVFLHGHLDVVPASSDQQFESYIEDGKLYGRGTSDMKAGCAINIELFKNNPEASVGLMLTCDEEIGGFDGAVHMIELGYLPKFIISTEPSCELIGNEAKGILRLEVVTRGKQGHSGYPWKNDNALHKQAEGMVNILRKYNRRICKEDCWETSVNFNLMEAGMKVNIIPGISTTKADIRYIPEENLEKIIDDFKTEFKDSDVKIILKEPAAFVEEGNHYVKKLAEASGGNSLVKKHGASDVRHFNSRGIPGVVFGPIGDDYHGNKEYVEIESIERVYKIIDSFLKKL